MLKCYFKKWKGYYNNENMFTRIMTKICSLRFSSNSFGEISLSFISKDHNIKNIELQEKIVFLKIILIITWDVKIKRKKIDFVQTCLELYIVK